MDKKVTTSQAAFMPTACADCGTWFFKVSKYRYHRRTTHRQNPFERTKLSGDCELLASEPGTSARAKCSLCGLVLLAKNADEHMLRHVQRFDCQDCGRKFRSARDLRSHRELHQAVQVVCPECGIGFRSKAVYRSHRARKHSEGVALSQQRSAARRFCPVCQKQLHKNSLQKHLLRAHGDDDDAQKRAGRPTCPVCAKEFSSDESLRRHSQLHDAQRNFICGECQKTFQTQRALQWHRKQSRHGRPPSPIDPPKAATSPPPLLPPGVYAHQMPSPLLAVDDCGDADAPLTPESVVYDTPLSAASVVGDVQTNSDFIASHTPDSVVVDGL